MKRITEKTVSKMMTHWLLLILVSACAGPPAQVKSQQYKALSRQMLEQLSRGVSGGFSAKRNSGRGFSNTVVFGDNQLFGDRHINPNLNLDAEQCVTGVQSVPATREYYRTMIATLSRCLNRMLVDGNPLMSHGYRNLDSQSQNYYAYLLNWRRFGSLEAFPQSDFSALSYFAGNGFFSGQ